MTATTPRRTPATRGGASRRDDRVLPYTRTVAGVILPFLVVASVLLVLLPTRTEQLWAWTIQSPYTAMLLGSAYVGGIHWFTGVLVARRWHRIWTGTPAVLVFATLMCVATFLHLDRFHAGHPSFIAWIVLYVTTPVLVLLVLVLNAPRDPRVAEPGDAVIPLAARVVLALIGAAAIAEGVALFAAPEAMIPVWPWPLTPLTSRVVGAILVLPGFVNLLLLVDARWSAFRLIFHAQLVSLGFIWIATASHGIHFFWDRPLSTLYVLELASSAVLYLLLVLGMEARTQRLARRPA